MELNRLTWVDRDGYAIIAMSSTNDIREKFKPREKDGLHGTGYDLTLLALAQIESFRPELKPLIAFDPDPNHFRAYSQHIDELRAFAEEFDKALDDPFTFAFLLDNATFARDYTEYGIDALPTYEEPQFGVQSAYAEPTQPQSTIPSPYAMQPAAASPHTNAAQGLLCPQCGNYTMNEIATLGHASNKGMLRVIFIVACVIIVIAGSLIVASQVSSIAAGRGGVIFFVSPAIIGIAVAAFIGSFINALRRHGRTVRQCSTCGYTEFLRKNAR